MQRARWKVGRIAATGEVSVNDSEAPPPLTVTRTIPAKVGTVFGYRFRLEGESETMPLTVRVTHPANAVVFQVSIIPECTLPLNGARTTRQKS